MVDDMTDKERIDTQLATLYDLRLQVKESEKETYRRISRFTRYDSTRKKKQINSNYKSKV